MSKEVVSRQNKLENWPIPKLVVNLSLPVMLSLLVQSMYNVVDSMFVARISEASMTATSLGFSAQMLMTSTSVGLGVGVNSLMSRTLGKKKMEEAKEVARNGLFLAVCTSLVFMLLGIFAVPAFMRMQTDDPELVALGTQYLQICMTLNMGIYFAVVGERLLQATGRSNLSMIAQVSGCVVNIILDPVMIFGYFGFQPMGVRGAAIATVVGQFVSAILALVLNWKYNPEVTLNFKGFRPSGKIISDLYRVSLPNMLVSGLGSVMMVFMNRYLIGYTTTAVACYGVYFKLKSFLSMPSNGLAQGIIPIVGYNYGAKRPEKILLAVKTAMKIAFCIMVAGTFVFELIPGGLMRLYDAEGELLTMGARVLRVTAIGFIPTGVAMVMDSSFSGMGKANRQMISNLIRQVGVLPLAYLYGGMGGLELVWLAMPTAEILALIYSASTFAWLYNKQVRHLKPSQDNVDSDWR